MKTSAFALLLSLTLWGCASAGKKKNILPPDTEITVENAASVTAYENTPESVVMYFYASKIRKDEKWKEVVIPESTWDERMHRKMQEYSRWTFLAYRLVSTKDAGEGKVWVTLYMKIKVGDETDDGQDEATVSYIDGKWLISEVPT